MFCTILPLCGACAVLKGRDLTAIRAVSSVFGGFAACKPRCNCDHSQSIGDLTLQRQIAFAENV
jgi:hypothetical protein